MTPAELSRAVYEALSRPPSLYLDPNGIVRRNGSDCVWCPAVDWKAAMEALEETGERWLIQRGRQGFVVQLPCRVAFQQVSLFRRELPDAICAAIGEWRELVLRAQHLQPTPSSPGSSAAAASPSPDAAATASPTPRRPSNSEDTSPAE